MSARRYDILAVDLDGTLLDPSGCVTDRNRLAVRAAKDAGLEVVVCTGRGLVESRLILDAIDGRTPPRGWNVAPAVVAGGAMVADAAVGRTMHRWPMDTALVHRIVARFADARVASMVLKDPDVAGFDYLIVDTGPLDPVNLWWFEKMGVQRRHIAAIDADEHPEHTVRVGFAAATENMYGLGREIMSEFREQATLHHFAAVSAKHATEGGRDDSIHILEAFDPRVSKWTAIEWLAARQGVAPGRIAAIGDEINDVAMLRSAGLGVAMGNAAPAAKDVARHLAPTNAEDGLAFTIGRILEGAW
jgi:hydroxymethylpyrimidine pyrophosphatase-like HAD family hydrolase